MIDLHNERSLRKESTRTNLNGTPDCDGASPRKKAPLLKLDGTPDRDGRSYLKKASPAKMHGAVLLLKSLVTFCLLGNVTPINIINRCGIDGAVDHEFLVTLKPAAPNANGRRLDTKEDKLSFLQGWVDQYTVNQHEGTYSNGTTRRKLEANSCLLYTSDAADE